MHKTILSSLNTSFNTKVYLLNEITNKNGVYYYLAETQFGDMTLIVELWHKVATE